ncbi:MAG: GDP-L-fucose synthase family protein [Candidatus Acidiferrales bacterium]
MNSQSRIFVAGHRGLVGSAVLRRLRAAGHSNLVLRSHAELDLTEQMAVRAFFTRERPEYVFLAAAKVGGILANANSPADFISQNLLLQTNVIQEAYRAGVRRLLFLGSSCIYPRLAPQPLKEEYLLTGPLEWTNRAYAVAKIAGIEMCRSYHQQYGAEFVATMPANLYGPGDRYDVVGSHVIPALLRKMHEAKTSGAQAVRIWGTGAPRREFLYSEDAADACVLLMNLEISRLAVAVNCTNGGLLVNIGCGEDITIRELAERIARVVGFEGRLTFDPSMPDGTPQKVLDTSRMTALGWGARTSLEEGLRRTYRDFNANCESTPRNSLVSRQPA